MVSNIRFHYSKGYFEIALDITLIMSYIIIFKALFPKYKERLEVLIMFLTMLIRLWYLFWQHYFVLECQMLYMFNHTSCSRTLQMELVCIIFCVPSVACSPLFYLTISIFLPFHFSTSNYIRLETIWCSALSNVETFKPCMIINKWAKNVFDYLGKEYKFLAPLGTCWFA